jgi:hypothetical protein
VSLLALGGWKATRVAYALRDATREVSSLRSLAEDVRVNPADTEALGRLLNAARAAAPPMRRLDEEVAPLAGAIRLVGSLPAVAWVQPAPDVLQLASALTGFAARAANDLDRGAGSAGLADPRRAAAAIAADAPALDALLAEAEAAAARLDGVQLMGPLGRYGEVVAAISPRLPALRRAVQLTPALADALGLNGPRRYLLLGQNEREIRATGGFIGTVGSLVIDQGAISQVEYESSYLVDGAVPAAPPPAPIGRYLGLAGWYLRDSNWWPDFPSSAGQALARWRQAGRPEIDAVIAFDSTLVRRLIDALDGIDVPGLGAVSGEGFERAALGQLYTAPAITAAGGYHEAKAAFLVPVARALIARLNNASPQEIMRVIGLFETLLEEEHIQISASRPVLANPLSALGWDGALPNVDGDSLLVVDSTVSYGDSWYFVRPTTELRVDVDDVGRATHELELQYANRFPDGYPDWMNDLMIEGRVFDPNTRQLSGPLGFWGNWLRVYLPPDASIIGVEGMETGPPAYQESGRIVVGGYLPVPPGAARTVRVRYTTGGTGAAEYRIFVDKQAGTECRATTVTVRWPDRERKTEVCPRVNGWVTLR